jgi:regulator of telomere elongation helicase 1
MPKFDIRGVVVEFPFEPYDCQLVYMERVIQSLQERSHALLESPTG